jgi:hypothetical protein
MKLRSEARTGVQSRDRQGADGMRRRVQNAELVKPTRLLTRAALYASVNDEAYRFHEQSGSTITLVSCHHCGRRSGCGYAALG